MGSVLAGSSMHFAAFYVNDGNARTQALQHIYAALFDGMDLGTVPLTVPAVRTVPSWPDMKTLANLPLNMQCEWLEYKDKNLTTLRLLVIDVEVVTEVQKELDKSPSSS